MTDLSEITFDDIEKKIMSILCLEMDVKFNQSALYDRLLKTKYDETRTVHSSFKKKFLIVLRNLMSKYDVIVTKEKNIYYVICSSGDGIENTVLEDTAINTNIDNTITNDYELLNYIIDNNITEEFKYIDPITGNSIYHELVLFSNLNTIKKMINENTFNFYVLNKSNQTPLEVSQNLIISNLLVMGLMEKILKIIREDRINRLDQEIKTQDIDIVKSEKENKIFLEETSLIYFFQIKIKKNVFKYKVFWFFFVILMTYYLLL
jgi:hypothetical protein